MAGRLGAPGSHYPGVLWAPVSWEGGFHTDQREGKAHCPAADRPRRLQQTGSCFSSSHHPQDPICLVLRKSTFQSISLVSKALRVLTREGNFLWGSQENKKKTIRHFFLDDVSAILSLRNGIVSLQSVCSWQQKRSRALPLCTGFLLNEQLPCASHPSWVLGTQKGIACPPYNWQHACQPTD